MKRDEGLQLDFFLSMENLVSVGCRMGSRFTLILAVLSLMLLPKARLGAQNFSSVPGIVINHSPKSSGRYIGSPSIVILPNGDYVASHDFFGPSAAHGSNPISHIYRSADRGATWTHQATLNGQFWGNLFVHNDDLYLMGTTKEYGKIIIRKSTDGGASWTTPSAPTTGQLTANDGYHTAPMPMVVHEGRIWRAFEDIFAGGGWPAHFRSLVMSAPVDSDLLNASSWSFSNALPRNTQWLGGNFQGWLEGNMVVAPDGELVNMLRVDNRPVAASVDVDVESHTISFTPGTGFVDFPGGEKKFAIRFDEESQQYWALSNPVLPQYQNESLHRRPRNSLALMSSPDLRTWEIQGVILHHPNWANHGFQYPDWQVDGDDLIIASRTAHEDGLGGANNFHDANFLTFHRVEDFRTFHPAHVLVADTNNHRILHYQTLPGEAWVPLGTFASGSVGGAPLNTPLGLARDAKGHVYVGEQADGGRILRFDGGGNFLDVAAQEGVDFVGRPEALTVGPGGELFLSVAFGGNSDRIYKIDAASQTTTLLVDREFPGGALENPRGLAFADDGLLYVADRQSGQVRKFDGATGEFLGNLFSTSTPQGLAWDGAQQRLLVSRGAAGSTSLLGLSLDGDSTALYGSNDVGAAIGVTVIDGTVYWSDFNNGKIYALTDVDQKREVVSTGLAGPGHLLGVDKPRERNWRHNGMGIWHDNSNWEMFWGVPDSTQEIAVLGDVISAGATVVLDRDETVGGVRFLSPHGYGVSGHGRLTLDGGERHALIDVYSGNHQLQVEVELGSDLEVMIKSGASLTIQNTLHLHGNDLQKIGAGDLAINGKLDAGGGAVVVMQGVLSGSGTIGGWLLNASGVVSPGNSPGRLVVDGDFTQAAEAVLHLEVGGTGIERFDVLEVAGHLEAGGALELVLIDGFSPTAGDRFPMLRFETASGSFDRMILPALSAGLQWDVSQLLAPGGGYLSVVVSVPEPAAYHLGWIAVLWVYRSRRVFQPFQAV